MKVTYKGPNYAMLVRQIIKEYLPRAGEKIKLKAQGKLGTYQSDWPELAESTKRRKARQMRGRRVSMQRGGQIFGPTASIDTPLIDTSGMAASGKHRERGMSTIVSFAFPTQMHEQDPLIEQVKIPPNRLPARPYLGPALDESLDPIADDLEAFVAAKL